MKILKWDLNASLITNLDKSQDLKKKKKKELFIIPKVEDGEA